MNKSLEEKRVEWAKENVPLLVVRGEDALREVVRQAAKEIQVFQFVFAVVIAVVTAFAGSWLQRAYMDETVERSEQYFFVVVTATVLGTISWYLSEQLFRFKVKRLADAM